LAGRLAVDQRAVVEAPREAEVLAVAVEPLALLPVDQRHSKGLNYQGAASTPAAEALKI
jgi:hypothetical protein